MTSQIQFISISPEQLQDAIIKGVKTQLEELKKDFQPKEPTEWLTRNDLKQLLKVDLSTIHNWCKKGKLKSYGIGSRVYFKRSEIEEMLTPLNS
ncbi:helix-turn-helix domain-containing protein [Plebeiibacterium sediminum]|uniref:Helix-turn-helix domain-containing protein n=1 Tax=Plebeiibacterium sediminum TaxID=2992112 RepID=A0AAE3SEW8_9BACT|nr:helix-turn-helix domain-containing protein [Plebeiobacterium sediminum]MCW3786840.1 helix-turn-helix domain-containing protein [Plebeiobacterium sediminum]